MYRQEIVLPCFWGGGQIIIPSSSLSVSGRVIYPLGSMKSDDWGKEVMSVEQTLGDKPGGIAKLKYKGPQYTPLIHESNKLVCYVSRFSDQQVMVGKVRADMVNVLSELGI